MVFAGYPDAYETEGTDRPSIDLMGKQNELISAVAAANPRTVVVLNTGAPVSMPWVDQVAAIVEAYLPRHGKWQCGCGCAVGQGQPVRQAAGDLPGAAGGQPGLYQCLLSGRREVNYGEGIFVGYRYYDKKDVTPLFPFGHGLSYTTFAYSGLKVPRKVKAGQKIEVSLTVKNTGKTAGKEVVQLYVSDLKSALPRPPKELKGFIKVALKPDESQTVTFSLDERSLAFYDPHRKAWVAEPGEFEVLVGSSSRDIRAEGEVQFGIRMH